MTVIGPTTLLPTLIYYSRFHCRVFRVAVIVDPTHLHQHPCCSAAVNLIPQTYLPSRWSLTSISASTILRLKMRFLRGLLLERSYQIDADKKMKKGKAYFFFQSRWCLCGVFIYLFILFQLNLFIYYIFNILLLNSVFPENHI